MASSKKEPPKKLADLTPAAADEPAFFEEIDTGRREGRGSCCTLWSFYLLFATLVLLGVAVLLWLRRG